MFCLMIIASVLYKENRILIECEGGEKLNISPEAALRLKPSIGEASAEFAEELRAEAEYFSCRERALKLLAIRSHSEKEMAVKLAAKKFSRRAFERTIAALKSSELLNDAAFAAEYAKRAAESKKQIGAQKIALALAAKGIAKDIIAASLADAGINELTETERCVAAANKKLKTLIGKQNSRDKLISFLGQRGFQWNVIRQALSAPSIQEALGGETGCIEPAD